MRRPALSILGFSLLSITLLAGNLPQIAFADQGAKEEVQSPEAQAIADAIHQINQIRVNEGAKELQENELLDLVAYTHSVDMSRRNELSHTSKTGESPETRVAQTGFKANTVGENIARHDDLEATFAALLKSQNHREQLTNPQFTHIGIGVVRSREGLFFVTQIVAEEVPREPELAPAHRSKRAKTPPSKSASSAQSKKQKPASAKAAPSEKTKSQDPKAAPAKKPRMRLARKHVGKRGLWIKHKGLWWYFAIPKGSQAGTILEASHSQSERPKG